MDTTLELCLIVALSQFDGISGLSDKNAYNQYVNDVKNEPLSVRERSGLIEIQRTHGCSMNRLIEAQ